MTDTTPPPAADPDRGAELDPGADRSTDEAEDAVAVGREHGRGAHTSLGSTLRHDLRTALAVALAAMGVLVMMAAPVAIWARTAVLNTDRFVATVEPLAKDPGIQDAVIAAVNRAVVSRIDLTSRLEEVLPAPVAGLIGPPLQRTVVGIIDDRVTQFVRSDAFVRAWSIAATKTHAQLGLVLTGESAVVGVDDSGTIILDLAPVVERVKDRLVEAGITAARAIPSTDVTIVVAQVAEVTAAQEAVRLLDRYAAWLPWLGLALLAGGIGVARRRRRALIAAMGALAAGMAALGAALVVGRGYLVDASPATALPPATLESVFDTVVSRLRDELRVIAAVALAVAFGAWITGSTREGTMTRRTLLAGLDSISTRLVQGPVGRLVAQHAAMVRAAILVLGLIVLVFWGNPSLGVAVTVVVAVAAIVLASYWLAPRAAAHAAGQAAHTAQAGRDDQGAGPADGAQPAIAGS